MNEAVASPLRAAAWLAYGYSFADWSIPQVNWPGPWLCHCVFGNPFHPPTPLLPSVLDGENGTVRRLAEVIYQERRMPEGRLETANIAILADALEEAGCTNSDIFGHCRGPGPHVLGCWVLDLILGKG